MKKNKGITLIALIITIIILIILTAITINNVIGPDLIGLAGSAAGNYIDAGKEEEDKISELMSKAGEVEPKGPEEIYTVELQVDEANVTGEKIPIQVSKITKTGEENDVSEALTYTYYLENTEKASKTEKTYEFSGLDKTKSYTIKVIAKDEKGNYGEGSIKVLSFSIEERRTSFKSYFRCTNGMTWTDWCTSSSYSKLLQGGYYAGLEINISRGVDPVVGQEINVFIYDPQVDLALGPLKIGDGKLYVIEKFT